MWPQLKLPRGTLSTPLPHVMLGVAEAVQFGFTSLSLGFGEMVVQGQIWT